jgi:hypothetical protein
MILTDNLKRNYIVPATPFATQQRARRGPVTKKVKPSEKNDFYLQ